MLHEVENVQLQSSQILSLINTFQTEAVAPVVVAIEQAASPQTIESRVAADGMRYTWTEFMDYYDNADIATEMWEAAQDVAPPEPAQTLTTPRFEPGSIVRVLAATTPGVRPMHAEVHYYVAPIGSKKRSRVSGALLVPTSIDGPAALFRGDGRSGGAGARAIARANDSAERQ